MNAQRESSNLGDPSRSWVILTQPRGAGQYPAVLSGAAAGASGRLSHVEARQEAPVPVAK
jgi:hypothetical protein